MKLTDFEKKHNETQEQFLDRTYWNSVDDVVFVFRSKEARDNRADVIETLTIEEARARTATMEEGLKTELEPQNKEQVGDLLRCHHPNKSKVIEETINKEVPDKVYWICEMCGKKFDEGE